MRSFIPGSDLVPVGSASCFPGDADRLVRRHVLRGTPDLIRRGKRAHQLGKTAVFGRTVRKFIVRAHPVTERGTLGEPFKTDRVGRRLIASQKLIIVVVLVDAIAVCPRNRIPGERQRRIRALALRQRLRHIRRLRKIRDIHIDIARDPVHLSAARKLPHAVISGVIRLRRVMRKPDIVFFLQGFDIQLRLEIILSGIDSRRIAGCRNRVTEALADLGLFGFGQLGGVKTAPGGLHVDHNRVRYIVRVRSQMLYDKLPLLHRFLLRDRLRKEIDADLHARSMRIFDILLKIRIQNQISTRHRAVSEPDDRKLHACGVRLFPVDIELIAGYIDPVYTMIFCGQLCVVLDLFVCDRQLTGYAAAQK